MSKQRELAQMTASMKGNIEFNAIKVDALDRESNSEFDISEADSLSASDISNQNETIVKRQKTNIFRNRENEAPKLEKKITEMMGIDNSKRSSAQHHSPN